jgi:hypothetical protein
VTGRALPRIEHAVAQARLRWAVLCRLTPDPVTARPWSRSFGGGNALVLRAILGREPRSLKQYFHELATRQS